MALAELTLAAVLGLAFLMNYSGAIATLGLAFAATGVTFPFTGSDASATALFGTLQLVTAGKVGRNPVLVTPTRIAYGATASSH